MKTGFAIVIAEQRHYLITIRGGVARQISTLGTNPERFWVRFTSMLVFKDADKNQAGYSKALKCLNSQWNSLRLSFFPQMFNLTGRPGSPIIPGNPFGPGSPCQEWNKVRVIRGDDSEKRTLPQSLKAIFNFFAPFTIIQHPSSCEML